MKVVLAGTYSGRGGVQTHLHWLSRALLEGGHQVLLYSLGPPLESAEQQRAAPLLAYGDFQIFTGRESSAGQAPTILQTPLKLIRALRAWRPDAYLACGTGLNLFLPAICSGACRRRVFHEVMSGESSGWSDSRWAVRAGFHQVLAQASPVAAHFSQHFHWSRPIPVLPAFPEPLEITGRLPQAGFKTVTLGRAKAAFFGRLVPHKGGLWLVNQWPELSNSLAELHLFGSGPELQSILDLVRSQGWEDRIFCHGPYPEGQAYIDLLASFDLTLLPTTGSEGAPLVLLESMACAVPFVAFDAGGIPDYANADCEIVSAKESGSFVAAIKRICSRLNQGTLDHSRLQKHYHENFSYQRLAEKWLDWLKNG